MDDRLRILSDFIYNLNFKSLSEEVVKTTKQYIADYYASSFAGKLINSKFSNVVEKVINETGDYGTCSVLCSRKKYSAETSAFINAIYAHGADMDDGNKKAMGHVAAHVISTAFSVGEEIQASGKEIISSIIAGYEIYNRVAASVQPGLVHRGFHSTGTAGAIACAAVASKLYKLDKHQIYNAMSFASVQASGLIIIAESGQTCKPINPANAARTGIFSAKCAREGIEAPTYTLESKKGWAHAMSDTIDDELLLGGLGNTFTILESYLKPYPSCRHTHCGIEALIRIREQILNDGDEIDNISSIKLFIYKNAISIAGSIKYPRSNEDTKFSIHYSCACAMYRGKFGLEDLNISNLDKNIESIINKITLIEDNSLEDVKKGIRGAKVHVLMNNGKTYSHSVMVPKGDPANPFSDEDVYEKLTICSSAFNVDSKWLFNNIYKFDLIDKFHGINSLMEVQK